MLVIADAEKPSAIAGLMGSEWSEVTRRRRRRCCWSARTSTAPTTQALLHPAGPAHRGLGAVGEGPRSAPVPTGRWRWPPQLMVELCGARLVPGHDRRARRAARAAGGRRCAASGLEHLIGIEYSERARRRDPRPARLRGRRTVGWRVPTWRAADTTREVDLIEEVARIDGVWKVPAVMPPHADAVGRLVADVRLRRRGDRRPARLRAVGGGDARASPTRGCADRLRLAAGRPPPRAGAAWPTRWAPTRRCCGRCVFPGLLRLGAAQPRRRALAGVGAVRDRPASCSRSAGGAARPAGSAWPACWRARTRSFSDAEGRGRGAERRAAASSSRCRGRRRSRSCIPGRRRGWATRGLARRAAPAGGGAFGIEATVRVFELDLDELARRARQCRSTAT